ncbi:MAG: ABC transporter permease subunit [Mariprofundaceae bacterium]|nr:ABC transporter permease subunit [Mariprofundaceae bacterium]
MKKNNPVIVSSLSLMAKQIIALCRKEWRTCIDTPLAYVIGIAFLVTTGFFFSNSLFLVNEADMRGWFAVLPLLLIFFVPAMAMRFIADERRSGTFELLATLPVGTLTVVLGKFLSLFTQLAVLIGLTLLYPWTLSGLGTLDGGQMMVSYIALLLLAGSYAAICLYASALTGYEVIAYVFGLVLLLTLFLLLQVATLFPPFIQNVLTTLSPVAHYQSLLRGVLNLGDVVYLLMVIGVFISLCSFELERRRWR